MTFVPGSGRPTDVGRPDRSEAGRIDTRLHSVSPYIGTTSTPGHNATRSSTTTGDRWPPVFVIQRRCASLGGSRRPRRTIVDAMLGSTGRTVTSHDWIHVTSPGPTMPGVPSATVAPTLAARNS